MQILARTLVPSLMALALSLALTAAFMQVRAGVAAMPSLADLVPSDGRPADVEVPGASTSGADARPAGGTGTVVEFTILP